MDVLQSKPVSCENLSKRENSNGYFSSFPLSQIGTGDHGMFSETDGGNTASDEREILQKNVQISQAIGVLFESWEAWQRRVVFSGLINRFGKAQLRSLNMAVESVFHRDFLANWKDMYPMKKIRSALPSPRLENKDTQEATDEHRPLSPQVKAKSETVIAFDEDEKDRQTEEAPPASKTTNTPANLDGVVVNGTLQNNPILYAKEKSLPAASTIISPTPTMRAISRQHEHMTESDQSNSSSRNLSPIDEVEDKNGFGSPTAAATPSQTNFSVYIPLYSVTVQQNAPLSSSAQSAAPSLSPIEETSLENSISPVSDSAASFKLKSANSPERRNSLSASLTENQTKKSPRKTMASTPKKISKPKTGKSDKTRSAVEDESPDLPVRCDSSASIWIMGPTDSVNGDAASEFQSRVTPLSVSNDDFFTSTAQTKLLGKFVTTQSKAGSQFMEKFDATRNKAPCPTSKQLYKNEKFWSPQHTVVDSKSQRLKELFRKQLNQIWNWLSTWEGHRRVRLLLQLLSQADSSTLKFVADCIKLRLAECSLAENIVHLLPDGYWVQVFSHLDAVDISKAGQVCKRWYCIAHADVLWRKQCEEIGLQFAIPNFVELMEKNAQSNETLDWKQAYIELHQRMHLNASKITALTEPSDQNDNEEETSTSAEDESDDYIREQYKDYIPFWKLKDTETLPKKKIARIPKERLVAPPPHQQFPAEEIRPYSSNDEKRTPEQKSGKSNTRTLHISPVDVRPTEAQVPGGFLQMWKNIKEDLKDDDAGSISKRSDKCYDVDLIDELLTDEELDIACEGSHLFAVDHRVKAPQAGSGKFWLVDSRIIPVKKVKSLEGHRGPVCCIMCHGKRIFSGGLDRRIRLWTSSGESFAKFEDSLKGSVVAMAIGDDEKCRTLYTASWDLSVSVWDCLTYKRQSVLIGHKDTVSALAVDSKYIISCCHDGTTRVWDIATNQCIRIIKHHEGAVQCLSYADKLIITGGADKLILMSSPDSGALLKTLRGHKSPVNAVQRQHSLVVSGDFDGYVKFWSLDGDGCPMESVQAHEKQINDISFHGGRFFTASSDKLVKEWELMTMTCVRVLQGHTQEVTGVEYMSKYLVTSSRDSTVRLWFWGNDDDDDCN